MHVRKYIPSLPKHLTWPILRYIGSLTQVNFALIGNDWANVLFKWPPKLDVQSAGSWVKLHSLWAPLRNGEHVRLTGLSQERFSFLSLHAYRMLERLERDTEVPGITLFIQVNWHPYAECAYFIHEPIHWIMWQWKLSVITTHNDQDVEVYKREISMGDSNEVLHVSCTASHIAAATPGWLMFLRTLLHCCTCHGLALWPNVRPTVFCIVVFAQGVSYSDMAAAERGSKSILRNHRGN